MKRGEVWTVAGGASYAAKPRPVVIVQADGFTQTDSITVCPITSDPAELPLFRVQLEPSKANGLRSDSRVMADKVTTVRKRYLGRKIGELSGDQMAQVGRVLVVFLGLA